MEIKIDINGLEDTQLNSISRKITDQYKDIAVKKGTEKGLFPPPGTTESFIITVSSSLAYEGMKKLFNVLKKAGGSTSLDRENIQRFAESYLQFELGVSSFELLKRIDDVEYSKFIYSSQDGKHYLKIFLKDCKVEYKRG